MSFLGKINVKILGSGTSTGVPVIGCDCAVCQSGHTRNKRKRASILVSALGRPKILVDAGPDLRQQLLEENCADIEHIVLTHLHADHCHGLDDLRSLYFYHHRPLHLYVSPLHVDELKTRFNYIFGKTGYHGTRPQIELHILSEGMNTVGGWQLDHVHLPHGHVQTSAFRWGHFAYATDFKSFPKQVSDLWRGKIHTLIASGIRDRPHQTHSSIPETINIFKDLEVKRGIISHLSHEVDYIQTLKDLPIGTELAYDRMPIVVPPLNAISIDCIEKRD